MIFFFNDRTIKAFGLERDPSRHGFHTLMQKWEPVTRKDHMSYEPRGILCGG
jgi:hypothetical protein